MASANKTTIPAGVLNPPVKLTERGFTEADHKTWSERGRNDARTGRNALMRPTRSGVFYDIDPPDDWTEDFGRKAARAYWDAFCSTTPAVRS